MDGVNRRGTLGGTWTKSTLLCFYFRGKARQIS